MLSQSIIITHFNILSLIRACQRNSYKEIKLAHKQRDQNLFLSLILNFSQQPPSSLLMCKHNFATQNHKLKRLKIFLLLQLLLSIKEQ